MKEDIAYTSGKITIRMMAESALLVALAAVLNSFALIKLPNGGSDTIGSMIPIMLVSIKYPFLWSLTVALCYSLIQIMQGFYAPPVASLVYYVLMTLLDYFVAFGALCLAGPIYRAVGDKAAVRLRLALVTVICFGLRFACHFLSGIIIWGAYAPEGQPVWLYSLVYNGSYIGLEILISGVILFVAGQKLLDIYLGRR